MPAVAGVCLEALFHRPDENEESEVRAAVGARLLADGLFDLRALAHGKQ